MILLKALRTTLLVALSNSKFAEVFLSQRKRSLQL